MSAIKANQVLNLDGDRIGSVVVDSIANMKNLNTEIEANATVELLGYYSKGDGGGGTFYWDSTSIEDDNGGTIIEATGVVDGRWIRNYSGAVNVKWFGAKGDNSNDDTWAVNTALNYFKKVFIPKGEYKLTSTLTLTDYNELIGEGQHSTKLNFITTSDIAIEVNGSVIRLEKFTLKGLETSLSIISETATASAQTGVRNYGSQNTFTDINVEYFDYGIIDDSAYLWEYNDIAIRYCRKGYASLTSADYGDGISGGAGGPSQHGTMQGSVMYACYIGAHLQGTRNFLFSTSDFEGCTTGLILSGSIYSLAITSCWIEQGFYGIVIDSPIATSDFQYIDITSSYISIGGDRLPVGEADANAAVIYLKDTSGATIKNLSIKSSMLVEARSTHPEYLLKGVSSAYILGLLLEGNLWTGSPTISKLDDNITLQILKRQNDNLTLEAGTVINPAWSNTPSSLRPHLSLYEPFINKFTGGAYNNLDKTVNNMNSLKGYLAFLSEIAPLMSDSTENFVTVTLDTGFDWDETLYLRNVDLSFVNIVQTDAIVVSRLGVDAWKGQYTMCAIDNAKSPNFDCDFNFDVSATNRVYFYLIGHNAELNLVGGSFGANIPSLAVYTLAGDVNVKDFEIDIGAGKYAFPIYGRGSVVRLENLTVISGNVSNIAVNTLTAKGIVYQ